MDWTQWITLGLAVIGSTLGAFNTWQGWRDRRVRLRVLPRSAIFTEQPEATCLSIEVINAGSFAVTIDEIGLLIGRPRGELPARSPIAPNYILNGQFLPARLGPHNSITAIVDARRLPNAAFSRAYALTAANKLATGDSPALRSILRATRGQ